ncbi:MAG: dephospho-CoA kinase [Candidatus Aminicenantes bacterium]|nr:dephospho-CoA kinase [Candidatus Aminicenantes bacterium]
MYKIGLTGGICTGKTYVLNILEEVGCYTAKADIIAKNIIFSGDSEISSKIIEVFGEDIYDKDSGLNKEKFSKSLFEDPKKRNFINNFIHPLVASERDKMYKELAKAKIEGYFIYESALLVESGTYKSFDKIIVTYTNPEEQRKRLTERDGIGEEEAKERIRAQFPISEKLKVADYSIDTSGSHDATRKNTLETFHLLKKSFEENKK